MSQFTKATKQQAKLRLALEGPAGFGKTLTSLIVARALVGPDGKIAFIDTENGSAAKYADVYDFDTIALEPPFHPDRFVELIRDAEENGYDAVVADSLSHAWNGQGGTLELVDQFARAKYKGDSHRAWKDAGEVQQRLVDAILRSRIHVIACMRTKADYVRDQVEKDGKTSTVIRKQGVKVIQRDEFDYEFDIVGRFEQPAVLTITKSRCFDLPPTTAAADATDPRSVIEKPGEEFTKTLAAWLGSGEALPKAATPAARKKLEKLIKDLEANGKAPGRFAELGWQAVADAFAVKEFGHGIGALTGEELKQTNEALTAYLDKQKNGGDKAAEQPAEAPAQETLT